MPVDATDDPTVRPSAGRDPYAGGAPIAHPEQLAPRSPAASIRLRFAPFILLRFEPLGAGVASALAGEYSRHLYDVEDVPEIEIVESADAVGSGADAVAVAGPRGSPLAYRVARTGNSFRVAIGPADASRRYRPLTAGGAVRHAIEPVLFSALPPLGAAFVHGGAVAIGGRGIAIFGPRGSGKTTVVFDLIGAGARSGACQAAFLAGDKFPLAKDGTAFPYVRHLHVSAYTMERFDGMAERILSAAPSISEPASGTEDAASRCIGTGDAARDVEGTGARKLRRPRSDILRILRIRGLFGGLRARVSLWRKGELRCRLEDAVPGAIIGGPSAVKLAVWLERASGLCAGASAQNIRPEDLAAMAEADARSEFARAGHLASHPAFDAGSGMDAEAILREALSEARCFRLSVRDGADPREAGDVIRKLAGV